MPLPERSEATPLPPPLPLALAPMPDVELLAPGSDSEERGDMDPGDPREKISGEEGIMYQHQLIGK